MRVREDLGDDRRRRYENKFETFATRKLIDFCVLFFAAAHDHVHRIRHVAVVAHRPIRRFDEAIRDLVHAPGQIIKTFFFLFIFFLSNDFLLTFLKI